jgi:5'-nucleotidase (lipoprotein e(P4) family)
MRSILFALLLTSVILFPFNTVVSQNDVSGKTQDRLLASVSWYQNSGEMMALYYQGFNIAKQRLNQAVEVNPTGRLLAVVVDIDETMLDNSPYESYLIKHGDDRTGWTNWTEKSTAKALPGALEFARYADSLKVEVFYITNRDNDERKSTLMNLSSEGFPFANEEHLLTRGDTAYAMGNTSSKVGRRTKVSATHDIVLLIGDNLNDFSGVFEDRSTNNGKEAVVNNRDQFGKKFIILPNPMYGAWEKPVFDYKNGLSESQKAELMRSKLR